MKIILEGADGTGKTTLANILAFKYGLEVCHCTQHDPGDYEFYKNTARKDNIVWDRHTIGELIYPTVFNRKAQIDLESAYSLLIQAKKDGVKILVLTSDLDVIRKRLVERGTEHPKILKHLRFIDAMFRNIARWIDVPIIDTSKMTLQEIFDLVEEK